MCLDDVELDGFPIHPHRTDRDRILDTLKLGDLTAFEIARMNWMREISVQRRLYELRHEGIVETNCKVGGNIATPLWHLVQWDERAEKALVAVVAKENDNG